MIPKHWEPSFAWPVCWSTWILIQRAFGRGLRDIVVLFGKPKTVPFSCAHQELATDSRFSRPQLLCQRPQRRQVFLIRFMLP
jgi:hypothetical protein